MVIGLRGLSGLTSKMAKKLKILFCKFYIYLKKYINYNFYLRQGTIARRTCFTCLFWFPGFPGFGTYKITLVRASVRASGICSLNRAIIFSETFHEIGNPYQGFPNGSDLYGGDKLAISGDFRGSEINMLLFWALNLI